MPGTSSISRIMPLRINNAILSALDKRAKRKRVTRNALANTILADALSVTPDQSKRKRGTAN